MESARSRWSDGWVYPSAIRRGPKEGLDRRLDSNTLLGQIAFRTTFPDVKPWIVDTPYLRPHDQSIAQEFRPGTELRLHPIASRSFAMFPPLAAIHNDFIIALNSVNAHGLTVLDIFNSLMTVYVPSLLACYLLRGIRSRRIIGWAKTPPSRCFACSWTWSTRQKKSSPRPGQFTNEHLLRNS